MIPANFEYFAPTTIDEALKLIAQHGDDCKILSGGHSLVPVLKLRLATPGIVVDIGRIKELNFIKIDGNTIRIGALATHHAIASSPDIKQHCPLLADTAAQIGDQQVRNRGTIGGSLTHADPAADYPAAVLALGAEVVVRGFLARDGTATANAATVTFASTGKELFAGSPADGAPELPVAGGAK